MVVDDVEHVCQARTSVHLAEGLVGNREFIRCTLGDILLRRVAARGDSSQTVIFNPFGLTALDIAIGKLACDAVSNVAVPSCFISYSHKDEEFVALLYGRLRSAGIAAWCAVADMSGGKTLVDQIDRAITSHDKLLLIMSPDSMKSAWVVTEIRRAITAEVQQGQRKLFPIRLVDMESIQGWECFDADSGRDLAAEIRKYFIPDFSNWMDHIWFENAFSKLVRDLREADD